MFTARVNYATEKASVTGPDDLDPQALIAEVEKTDVFAADGVDRDELLRLADGLEGYSEHPIAQAIATGATTEVGDLPAPESFENVEGKGVQRVITATPSWPAPARAGVEAHQKKRDRYGQRIRWSPPR